MRALVATVCTPDDRKSLAAVRALSNAGYAVTVGGDIHRGQPFASRHASAKLEYPHPGTDRAGFLKTVTDYVDAEGIDFVFPTSDYTVDALTESDLREGGRLALPRPAVLAIAQDKLKTVRAAERAGVPTPKTYLPETERELIAVAEELRYPCVCKLQRGAGSIGLRYIQSKEILIDTYRWTAPDSDSVFEYGRPLIQERVPGESYDVNVICANGETRAAVTQRRVHTFPPEGGIGVEVETTDTPELREAATALMREVGMHGPAQAEFKRDPSTGRFWLIEINGRPWGTMAATIAAGVNVPLLTRQLAREGDIEPVTQYQVGLRYRWPFTLGMLSALYAGRYLDLLGQLRTGPHLLNDFELRDLGPHLSEAAFLWRRAVELRFRPSLRDHA